MKVIFLDIDGVLNSAEWDRHIQSFPYGARFNSCYLLSQEMILRLQDIVCQTGTNIVLISSWRWEPRAFNALIKQLNLYHLSIEDIADDSYTRTDEVKNWLKQHSYLHVTSYVIVDDYDDGFSKDEELSCHYVQPSYEHGLTDEKAAEIIKILNM